MLSCAVSCEAPVGRQQLKNETVLTVSQSHSREEVRSSSLGAEKQILEAHLLGGIGGGRDWTESASPLCHSGILRFSVPMLGPLPSGHWTHALPLAQANPKGVLTKPWPGRMPSNSDCAMGEGPLSASAVSLKVPVKKQPRCGISGNESGWKLASLTCFTLLLCQMRGWASLVAQW